MTTIPQEWIEAGVEGIDVIAGEAPEELLAEIAEAVLAAALPLVREAIARDIEAKRQERIASDWASLDESMEGHEAGMEFAFRIAARIARRGAL